MVYYKSLEVSGKRTMTTSEINRSETQSLNLPQFVYLLKQKIAFINKMPINSIIKVTGRTAFDKYSFQIQKINK